MDVEVKAAGWCCRCLCVPVEVVLHKGETCVRCAALSLGLPPDSHAGAVVAELMRREGEP